MASTYSSGASIVVRTRGITEYRGRDTNIQRMYGELYATKDESDVHFIVAGESIISRIR